MFSHRFLINTLSLSAGIFASLMLANPVSALPDFETLSPYQGPDILHDAVDLQYEYPGVCALKAAGTLECIRIYPNDRENSISRWNYIHDADSLNQTLGNQIAAFSVGNRDLCAIARDGRLACLNSQPPAGSFKALTNITDYGWACAIATDDRVSCWNDNFFGTRDIAIPSEATFLKQVDVFYGRFCGVNMTDDVVCWGEPIIAPPALSSIPGLDEQFGATDPATIGKARMITMSDGAACVVRLNGEVDCFGVGEFVPAYNSLLEGRRFESINISGFFTTIWRTHMAICGVTLAGNPECLRVNSIVNPTGLVSALPDGLNPRLVTGSDVGCLIDESNQLICYSADYLPSGVDLQSLNYPFPQPPGNLQRDDYSANATELFWDRPQGREPVTAYEIYRDDTLLATIENFSYFDAYPQTISATYTVRSIRGLHAGPPGILTPEGSQDSGTGTNQVSVDGNTISWPDDGWYQVQSATDYSSLCEGGSSCSVPEGSYIVINLTNGQRYEGISVGSENPTGSGTTGSCSTSSNITVCGNVISWSEPGWYQVQDASSYETICEGTDDCETAPGIYHVINHTTGERFEEVSVER